jgi:hypothetical protein
VCVCLCVCVFITSLCKGGHGLHLSHPVVIHVAVRRSAAGRVVCGVWRLRHWAADAIGPGGWELLSGGSLVGLSNAISLPRQVAVGKSLRQHRKLAVRACQGEGVFPLGKLPLTSFTGSAGWRCRR